LSATFSAEEVLAQLRSAIEPNFSSRGKQNRIMQDVTAGLIKAAWRDKMDKFAKDLKTIFSSGTEQTELQGVIDELNDTVVFIQLLGGLNPKAAAEAGIQHNFISAFHLLIQFIRSTQKWPDAQGLTQPKKNFLLLCYQTIAELLNVNCVYCDSSEVLNRCFSMILDHDLNGNLAELFIPPIRLYYSEFVLAAFRSRLSPHLLVTAVMASLRLGRDISDALLEIPDDGRKFAVLSRFEVLRDLAGKCAENCDDVEVAVKALGLYRKNRPIANRYFRTLSAQLSKWINLMLKASLPIKDQEVRSAHAQLSKLTKPLSAKDKENVLGIVKGTEMEQALKAVLSRTQVDLEKDQDPMVRDIVLMLN
jgi:hypothetical protein